MKGCKDRNEGRESVWFIKVWGDGSFAEKGDTEIEIWEGYGSKSFYEDVNNDVWVVKCRVELVAIKKLGQRDQKDAYMQRNWVDTQFENG